MRLMPELLQYSLFIGIILVTFFLLEKQYAKKNGWKDIPKPLQDTLSIGL
jgi:hypothetical protein